MWPWRRPVAAPVRAVFDAVVDLGPELVEGLAAEAAMDAAAAAIRAVPGASRVRVRLGGQARVQVRVFPPGRSEERDGQQWFELRATVEAAALNALQKIRPAARKPRGRFALPQVLQTGFAEAPQHLDALAELAALAQTVRAPAPRPAAPSNEADIAMLSRLLGFVLPAEGGATAGIAAAAMAAAGAAVRRFGSYAAVLAAPERELRTVPGLGQHSVAAVKLVHEAAVRLARAGVTGQPVLDDPVRLAAYLSAAVGRARVEQFRILFLDARGMLRADEVQATGTVNHTPVYPREVVRRALELEAAAVVLVHNHPSGDPTPSGEDLAMTAEIRRAAAALGVQVRDHVIVGNGRILSFRAEGLLD